MKSHQMHLINPDLFRNLIFNPLLMIFSLLPFLIGFILYYFPTTYSICLLINLTHLPCPFCGLSRAFIHLSHLELAEAVKQNLLILMIAPVLIWIILIQLLPLQLKRILYKNIIRHLYLFKILIYLFTFLIFFFGIARIIDRFYPIFRFTSVIPDITLLKILLKKI